MGWLDELASSVNVVIKLAAKHRLCTYQHPEPNKSKATQEQLEGFKKFLRWRTVVAELAEALPKHPSWVRALREAAEKNATREEIAAQLMAMKKWELWINEGPAAGLRRQHQFSRTADGWAPTKASSGKISPTDGEDELDDMDGLRAADLGALRFEQGSTGTPVTAQQEVDDQAEKWSEQWGCELNIDEPVWPKEMGSGMVELIYDELIRACASFPNHTGLGWDRWHPKVVLRLSKPLVQLLIAILMEAEKKGVWPRGGGSKM